MSTARVSVNIDGEVKQKAQVILNEIGMDLTTVIDMLLRTIVREERIPFDLRTEKAYREKLYRNFIFEELEKSKIEAADHDTVWLTHDDIVRQLNNQRVARNGL